MEAKRSRPYDRGRLLVVDDQVEQVESLKLLLEKLGFRVLTAVSVDAAYAVADTHPPDVLVLDWLLPGGGVAFVEGLRARLGRRLLPVLVITGLPEDAVHGFDELTGPRALLHKPYEVDELVEALGRLRPEVN